MKRREFLSRAVVSIFAVIGTALATAFVSVFPAGVRKRTLSFLPLLPVDEAPRRGVRKVRVPWTLGNEKTEKRIFLVATPGGLLALSSECSHLGCSVNWDRNRGEFVCPCHGGRYDRGGKRIAGPPPSPLARLPLKIEDGLLKVGLRV